MAVNTIVQDMADNPAALTKDERERRINVAERIIEIYSPSGKEGELMHFLFEELSSLGLAPRIDSAGNLICEIGTGSRSILLCPHADTVPGQLEVKKVGSLLYGRGASDAKGALISMLFAFEDLASEFNRDQLRNSKSRVILAVVVEEERGSRGLDQLIIDKLRADAAIFGEPCGLNKVTIGYRGHVPVTFEIQTHEAHASAPWLTTNSAELAFSIYDEIRNKLNPKTVAKQNIESVSVAITKIESGTVNNVIPGSARMSLDIRLPLGINTTSVVSQIKDIVLRKEKLVPDSKIIAEFQEATEPYRAKMNSRVVRAINRSILQIGSLKPIFVSKSGTGDMNTYARAFGVDCVTYGPGDTKLSHTPSEFVDLDEVFACVQVLIRAQNEFVNLED